MYIDRKYFGSFLSKKRVKKGLSQAKVAEALGYASSQFVSNWERGTSSPPLDKLPLISELLDIPPGELIELITSETEAFLKAELYPSRKSKKQRKR
jgi:transcriptional regulator with XRE-family HTH domain